MRVEHIKLDCRWKCISWFKNHNSPFYVSYLNIAFFGIEAFLTKLFFFFFPIPYWWIALLEVAQLFSNWEIRGIWEPRDMYAWWQWLWKRFCDDGKVFWEDIAILVNYQSEMDRAYLSSIWFRFLKTTMGQNEDDLGDELERVYSRVATLGTENKECIWEW